jgi:hypothetical protein
MSLSYRKVPYAIVFLLLGFATAATTRASDSGDALERQRLLEILRTAKPAPNPPGPVYSAADSESELQRATVGMDLMTGDEIFVPASGPDFAPPPADEGFRGAAPARDAGLEDRGGDSAEGVATPPDPLPDALFYPYQTIYKMLMRFRVAGIDYYYVCTAWSAGSFHVVSAGHCVYNFDPNDDGSTADQRWADEVWLWGAQSDFTTPIGEPDQAFGEAKGTYLRSYTGWTVDHNYDHDWSVITLNRRDGDHTGWMGRETDTAASLNFSGYSVETPYVPAGTLVQYEGFDTNNVLGYTCCRIDLSAFIYGGHSGGPSWRYDGADRWVQGIHSTSNRVGNADDTYLTAGKRTDLNNYMTTDAVDRPPTPRPDLIEYYFGGTDNKELFDNSVPQGNNLNVEYNALNSGFAASGTVTVDFYLSSNQIISPADSLIDSVTLSSLAAFTFANPTSAVTVPWNHSLGTYYLGWILSGTVTEYATTNNAVVISNETLTVTQAACAPDFTLSCPATSDSWSNNGAGSTDIVVTWGCTPSLSHQGPEYAYSFTAPPGVSNHVVIDLTGLSADLDLFALNGSTCAAGGCFRSSSLGGSSAERIVFDTAPGASYRIVVDGYQGATSGYTIELACSLFSDDFESGNTSAWSSVAL